jgi:glycosyltransferase involved in cell wall biosynthesis
MNEPPGSVRYPAITPCAPDGDRPFWSIMIPSYNCADYLRETLRSVRAAMPLDRAVQIEVVDDCSTRDDPAAVVAECGDPRVRFYRQPANVGPQANFTSCIQRARGEWVHILHGDDLVAPEFYATLEDAARTHPQIGAAFCRTMHIDGDGVAMELSELEAEEPGIHADLIGRLGIRNVIMFPSIVVKRDTYERLGGFHPELFHAADWDMWKRVALSVPVWYEPAPLAKYRVHQQSDTSALIRTGANIVDARHAIEVARTYLPAAMRDDLTHKARLYHALYAIELAEQMIVRRSWASAAAQLREGLRCSPSLAVAKALAQLAGRVLRA